MCFCVSIAVLLIAGGPTNMYATPIKQYYEVGNVLTCYADALPPATFDWFNTRTNEQFDSQGFNVTEDLVGTTQQMRCQARNTIQGFVYSDNLVVNVTVLGLFICLSVRLPDCFVGNSHSATI